MLADILLFWIGMQLNAPTWFYIILGVRFVINALNVGIKLGKAAS